MRDVWYRTVRTRRQEPVPEWHYPFPQKAQIVTARGIAAGTTIDGVKRLSGLFIPVYDAVVEKSLAAEHWHADETRRKVYAKIEGKNSNN